MIYPIIHTPCDNPQGSCDGCYHECMASHIWDKKKMDWVTVKIKL